MEKIIRHGAAVLPTYETNGESRADERLYQAGKKGLTAVGTGVRSLYTTANERQYGDSKRFSRNYRMLRQQRARGVISREGLAELSAMERDVRWHQGRALGFGMIGVLLEVWNMGQNDKWLHGLSQFCNGASIFHGTHAGVMETGRVPGGELAKNLGKLLLSEAGSHRVKRAVLLENVAELTAGAARYAKKRA